MFSDGRKPKLVEQRSVSQCDVGVGRRKTAQRTRANLAKTRTDQNLLAVGNLNAAQKRVGSAATAMAPAR